MLNAALSLFLAMQLFTSGTLFSHGECAAPLQPARLSLPAQPCLEAQPVFWGLIDPELSTWFSRLPSDESEQDERILWDWSWRGFLAALFGCPVVKEAQFDAAQA